MGVIPPHACVNTGWQANLLLRFARAAGGRTILSERRHRGPLQVQRPFYPEANGTCHVYILHPPGGVVGGDRLAIEAELAPGAQVLLTTPAAGKFYRSSEATAQQTQILRVAAGAALEWLPQETIVFKGAQVRSLTRVELTGDAGFIGWEILCLGRPAAGEIFERGVCRLSFEIWRDGLPLYLEQGHYKGGSELLQATWGLRGLPVTATLVCVTGITGLVERVRAAAGELVADEWFSASQLDGVLVCRYLGSSGERARRLFSRAWTILRPAVWDRMACPPQIWST